MGPNVPGTAVLVPNVLGSKVLSCLLLAAACLPLRLAVARGIQRRLLRQRHSSHSQSAKTRLWRKRRESDPSGKREHSDMLPRVGSLCKVRSLITLVKSLPMCQSTARHHGLAASSPRVRPATPKRGVTAASVLCRTLTAVS